MSETPRESAQFYMGQHGRTQQTIQRLQQENVRLKGFVEFVAWGEWAEAQEDGALFGDRKLRESARDVRDQARALIEGEREAA